MPAPRSPPVPLIDAWDVVTVYAPRSPTFHSSLTSLIHAYDAQDALLLRMDDTRYPKRDNWSKSTSTHVPRPIPTHSQPHRPTTTTDTTRNSCSSRLVPALCPLANGLLRPAQQKGGLPWMGKDAEFILRDSSPRPPNVQWLIQWLIQESKNSNMLFQPRGVPRPFSFPTALGAPSTGLKQGLSPEPGKPRTTWSRGRRANGDGEGHEGRRGHHQGGHPDEMKWKPSWNGTHRLPLRLQACLSVRSLFSRIDPDNPDLENASAWTVAVRAVDAENQRLACPSSRILRLAACNLPHHCILDAGQYAPLTAFQWSVSSWSCMHTCFIALASASVLHLPLWSSVVYGYMVPIREPPALVFPSPRVPPLQEPLLIHAIAFPFLPPFLSLNKEASSEPTASLRFFPDQSYNTSTITYCLPIGLLFKYEYLPYHFPCSLIYFRYHYFALSCRLIHTLHQPFFFHALPLRLSGALYATARSNQHCSSGPPRQPVADLPGSRALIDHSTSSSPLVRILSVTAAVEGAFRHLSRLSDSDRPRRQAALLSICTMNQTSGASDQESHPAWTGEPGIDIGIGTKQIVTARHRTHPGSAIKYNALRPLASFTLALA
ncbi:uncharacterized protein CLUP02_05592 [Colletotrichum lupini]|uniref:Uncharacterized protein n=1 Tax=Colletotrichum lupini TaxID=145971 RepID=A0A9Q8SNF3_9PEZI|nr:uncharacterized protein CLUP02_05592 [Colletotrichum lupini]UQC80110.1 hypothetical protein CLUP02_05592 [Colletotrichum lupini]